MPPGPKQIFDKISPHAKEMSVKLDEALLLKDYTLMGDLIFDCECEELDDQIDLKWYQAQIIYGESL